MVIIFKTKKAKVMAGENVFLSTVLTSLGTATLTGILFWAWLNTKFDSFKTQMDDLKEKNRDLEKRHMEFLLKEDHHDMRREDKEGFENQLREMRKDIKEMPNQLMNMIKQFIK